MVASACIFLACAATALAQTPVGSAFTYQGVLTENGEPVDGDADVEYRLFDADPAGNQVGPTLATNAIAVVSGRFTAQLDFGAEFLGQARWLEISVRHPAGVGAFVTLAPRQELTPAPYAIGLSLPFRAVADVNLGSVFEIVNNDMGWAGVFRNNNPANTDAALNVTSMGGPAGAFLNDSGGTTVVSRAIALADAIHAESQGGRGVYGLISSASAPAPSSAVRGENLSLNQQTSGVWGSSAGVGYGVRGSSLTGRGVFGEATSDFGFGVFGEAAGRSGTGVYGLHSHLTGVYPGVDGVTDSADSGAAGVRGRATSTAGGTRGGGAGALTYGVLGQSASRIGVGVRGESNTGVEGAGQQFGVFGTASDTIGQGIRGEATFGVYGLGDNGGSGVTGEAGNGSTFGVHAIGFGGRLSQPALRADGGTGPAIFAMGSRAVEGEGTEFGVRGVTWEETGVGGTFTNYADGVALSVNGRAEVNGTMAVNVLEILGGADLAERFDFSEDAEPGMVVAIDPQQPGKLRVSRHAHNTRVAGVISGANELSAGVILGTRPAGDRHLPVAMSGRVWVRCDTRAGGVALGEFLTTSDLRGHAMPVANKDLAEGAIIGKAMTSLAQGEQGMVLVLVNLQ